MNPAWKCSKCGDVHDDEEDAYECCRPAVVAGWLCPACNEFHVRKQDALDCCADESLLPRQLTADELEAAGQLRLIP